MNQVKFSVVMMAYNQADFISEAIESVLKQKHDYNWELLIADDCSLDETKEIVNRYITKYPNHIFYFKNEINLGLHQNYINILSKTKGEYIALLEADDYWIDDNKISLQIKLLDLNNNVAWCFTNGDVVDQNKNVLKEIRFDFQEIIQADFYFKNRFNPLNNTIVFRKICEPKVYPVFFYNVAQWDSVLHILRTLKGDIGFLPINGLGWRRHDNVTSETSSFSGVKRKKDWIKINNEIIKILPSEYIKYFKFNYVAYEEIAISYFKSKDYLLFLFYLMKMLINKMFRPINQYRYLFWKLRNEY